MSSVQGAEKPYESRNGYEAFPVYECVDAALSEEIVDLWLAEGLLGLIEAQRRVAEVVMVVRNPQGELAGMTTVYLQEFKEKDNFYFFMRMFIRSRDRGNNGMRALLSHSTRMFLREFPKKERSVNGVIVVLENRKFSRKGMKHTLEAAGYRFIEVGPLGNEVWCWEFSKNGNTGSTTQYIPESAL